MDPVDILHIQKSVIIGNSILGLFSLMGCLTIIFLFLFRPYLRDFIFKLTFFLSISESINVIAYLVSLDFLNQNQNQIYESQICKVQPILISYANTSSLLWILMICYCLHDLLVNKNRFYDKDKKRYLIIGYILPIFPTLLYV